MKIFLAPSTIKAVCDLYEKAVLAKRAEADAKTDARYRHIHLRFLRWKKTVTRSDDQMKQYGFPSRQYEEQYTRVLNLRAIARHKMTAGLIEVPDPYLSDIAQFLGPDEDMRL